MNNAEAIRKINKKGYKKKVVQKHNLFQLEILISFLLITNYLCGGGVISLFTNIEMTIPNKVSIILFVA